MQSGCLLIAVPATRGAAASAAAVCPSEALRRCAAEDVRAACAALRQRSRPFSCLHWKQKWRPVTYRNRCRCTARGFSGLARIAVRFLGHGEISTRQVWEARKVRLPDEMAGRVLSGSTGRVRKP